MLATLDYINKKSLNRADKPSWFTFQIGKLFTKCLLRPNSLLNFIRAILTDIDAVSSVNLSSDWRKCDMLAEILVQLPKV